MSEKDSPEAFEQVLSRLGEIEKRLAKLESLGLDSLGYASAERNSRREVEQEPLSLPITETVRVEAPEAIPYPVAAPPVQEWRQPHLETQVGLTWLNRIGVLTVVLGVAFFFKYAADRGLIGETGRVLVGVATALAALGLAEWIWRRGHRVYAQGITAAGVSILYLSAYVAFSFYHLIPLFVALLNICLITVVSALLALRYDSIAISALGLIGGYLTPLLISNIGSYPWLLIGYLLTLEAGAMALVRRKTWTRLEPLIVTGTSLVFLASWSAIADHFKAPATVLVFLSYALVWQFATNRTVIIAQILAAGATALIWSGPAPTSIWLNLLLATAGLVAARRQSAARMPIASFLGFQAAVVFWRLLLIDAAQTAGLLSLTLGFLLFLGYVSWQFAKLASDATGPGLQRNEDGLLGILALNGFLYFAVCYSILTPAYHDYLGAFAGVLAAIHLLTAWQLWKSRGADTPVMLAVGIAIAFLALAIPLTFSEFRITMFWAIEAATFTWIALRTKHARFEIAGSIVFALAVARLLLIDSRMYTEGQQHLLLANARMATFLITGVCLWLGARWISDKRHALAVYVTGHVVVLWALLAEIADWSRRRATDETASLGMLVASVLLALYGIALVVLGVATRSVINRIIGLVLLAIVVVKLYVYDVWQLDQQFRIVAFVVLGILLLTASFLYSRFRSVVGKLLDNQPDDQ